MIHQLNIEPYNGVGDLHFGMKSGDVAKILGSPEDIDTNYLGERTEDREPGILITYSQSDNSLVEFGFSQRVLDLKYKNINLFKEPIDKVLESLVEEDGNPYECLGFIIFLNLGITLTGFLNENDDDKAVTVFTKGRWDVTKDELKAFKYKPKSYRKK